MPRTSRITPGGNVFHVLNRGVGRQRLFDKPADNVAFESNIEETRPGIQNPQLRAAKNRRVVAAVIGKKNINGPVPCSGPRGIEGTRPPVVVDFE
ncbi:MAG: hypothetical protein WCJ09_22905 [Planctomycetota bacterium]